MEVFQVIGWRICLDCGNRGWFKLQDGGNRCNQCGSMNTKDWTEDFVPKDVVFRRKVVKRN